MSDFKQVSEQDFREFISHIEELVRDVTGICDPPLVTYNDFSDGKKWPESIMAKYHDSECYPKDSGSAYTWEENKYFIKENV